jgi:hypothetical protein
VFSCLCRPPTDQLAKRDRFCRRCLVLIEQSEIGVVEFAEELVPRDLLEALSSALGPTRDTGCMMPGSLPRCVALSGRDPFPGSRHGRWYLHLGRRAPRIANSTVEAFLLDKSDGSSRSRLHRLRRKLHDLTRVAKLSGSSSSYIRKPEGSVQPPLSSTVRKMVDTGGAPCWIPQAICPGATAAGSSLSHPCSQMNRVGGVQNVW